MKTTTTRTRRPRTATPVQPVAAPQPTARERITRSVAANRASDVVSYGVASRSAVEARAAVECAAESWLIRDLYVSTFIETLQSRGVTILP